MRLRPIGDADWPRLQDFVRRHFGFSHIPDRRFHEHWFRNCFGAGLERGGEAASGWDGRLLERADGTLAGALLVIALPCWFAGRETTLGYLSTGVVEDDARERGQGAGLYLWAYRSFPVVLAMSGNALSAPLNALMGRDIPGVSMRRFLRLNRTEAVALCRPEGRARAGRAIASAVQPPAGLSARWLDHIPSDYDALWREVRAGLVCSLDRSSAYLRWRCAAPYVDYQVLEIRRGGALVALAVCRPQATPAGSVTRIIEMIARRDDGPEAWRAIAAATAGSLFADFLVVGSSQDVGLAEAGFLPADQASGLDAVPHLLSPVEHRQWTGTFTLGGALASADASWRSPEAVYFTKGDGDRDWPTLFDLERLGVTPDGAPSLPASDRRQQGAAAAAL